MWTTWLERTLGQRPANENEPPAAMSPADGDARAADAPFAVKGEQKQAEEDALEVMP